MDLKSILEEYTKLLEIGERIKIKTKPMKTKGASGSLKKFDIVINSYLLDLGEDVVRYLILHELIHFKLRSRHHTDEFYNLLYSFMDESKVKSVRERILDRLVEINGLRKELNGDSSSKKFEFEEV